ncbi:MAG: 1-acyl-sn-glycerol-3-phosphate acyltransferase, partial [Sphaerochaetaceae bacterium]
MGMKNYGQQYRSMGLLWALARMGGGVALGRDVVRIKPIACRIQGPAIIVSNHVSMFDWYFISQAVGHVRIHMVMGRYFLGEKAFDTLLRH